MEETTGTVRCLAVSEHAAFTTIEDASGTIETFVLWFSPSGASGTPLELNARVVHGMWVSMLSAAHSNGLTVTVIHPNGSSQISSVRLGPL